MAEQETMRLAAQVVDKFSVPIRDTMRLVAIQFSAIDESGKFNASVEFEEA
jgi:hypothetical protein